MSDPFETEYRYAFWERIGMMCEDRDPTPEQVESAKSYARCVAEKMRADAKPFVQLEMFPASIRARPGASLSGGIH